MTEQDILQLRDLAEAGQVQFKERIVNKDDKYDIGCEMVAFSNSRGGRLIIGINDKEITHSANEFVITIPRKTEQVTNQGNLVTDQATQKTDPVNDQPHSKTDQAQPKTDPVNDQASPKSEQPNDREVQNTTKLAHETDPTCSKNEQPHIKLTQKQKDIRNFCSVPRTAKEIMGRLGLSDFYNNRKRYIYDLVEAGVLERTIPNKPNDPNQKYRRKQ